MSRAKIRQSGIVLKTGPSLSRRPAQRPAAEKMQVKMKDGLARARAHVKHGAATAGDVALLRQLGGNKLQPPQQRGVGGLRIGERGNVLARANQDVHRGLRLNVFERENLVVLMDQLRGNLLRADTAKNTIAHSSSARTSAFIVLRLNSETAQNHCFGMVSSNRTTNATIPFSRCTCSAKARAASSLGSL